MKYRKLPVIIEAIKFDSNDLSKMIEAWGAAFSRSVIEQETDNYLIIKTLEGSHKASFGDYIIKGIAGEFYPCKPDIFEKIYEAVK